MNATGPAFLRDRTLRLLLFGGKGGVGKTTCAAATALTFARRCPESSFLLVSTDPAHSLADSVAGSTLPPNLTLIELDATERLEAFKAGVYRRGERRALERLGDLGGALYEVG